MTSTGSASGVDDPDPGAAGSDLSSAFGPAAAASLRRGVRRRRKNPRGEAEASVAGRAVATGAKSEPPDQATIEDDMQDSRSSRSAVRAGRAAPPTSTPAPRHTDASAPARRFRVVRVRDRREIDMLLLAVAKKKPANGRAFIDLVREGSDGVFQLSEGTVYHELHRLENDRLIRVAGHGAARRYLLTTLGERVLTTRRRQWAAFSEGFDRVLESADESD